MYTHHTLHQGGSQSLCCILFSFIQPCFFFCSFMQVSFTSLSRVSPSFSCLPLVFKSSPVNGEENPSHTARTDLGVTERYAQIQLCLHSHSHKLLCDSTRSLILTPNKHTQSWTVQLWNPVILIGDIAALT